MQAKADAAQSIRHQRCSPMRRLRQLRHRVAILCLSISAAVTAGPLPPPVNVVYRIIPLAPSAYSAADINAKGQVAFTEIVAPGVTRARLYDGVKVRDLGSLGGNSTAVALNDLAQVTGQSYLAPNGTVFQAYRWGLISGMVNLSRPGVVNSTGLAINNLGLVAGDARFAGSSQSRGFRWLPLLGMRDLGTLNNYSSASAINDAGVAVGYSEAAPPQGGIDSIPTRWTFAPGPQPVTALPFRLARAYDINKAGHIVGFSLLSPNPSNSSASFLWTSQTGAVDLNVPGEDYAEHVNDKDMVAGLSVFGPSNGIGFVWTKEDGPLLLGTPGVDDSSVRDVNNSGQVVGRSNNRAYVWTRAAGLVDLNTRLKDAPDGFELDDAYAISDNGSIVARANTGLVLLVPDDGGKAPPVIGSIKALGAPRPGALLTFAAGFRDSDVRDAHTARWSWGDGSTGAGDVASVRGRGGVSGQHTYRTPGVYTVRLTVSDSGGERSAAQTTVVVGASGIVLAGDGSFMSARGASRLAPNEAGIANFSFRSAGDAVQGGGKAAIRFSAPGVEFDSDRYDALAHDPASVRYEGNGTLNGRPGYRFVLGVVRDAATAGPGRIHVRITHRDATTGAEVLDYDNAAVDTRSASDARAGTTARTAADTSGVPLIAGSKVRLGSD